MLPDWVLFSVRGHSVLTGAFHSNGQSLRTVTPKHQKPQLFIAAQLFHVDEVVDHIDHIATQTIPIDEDLKRFIRLNLQSFQHPRHRSETGPIFHEPWRPLPRRCPVFPQPGFRTKRPFKTCKLRSYIRIYTHRIQNTVDQYVSSEKTFPSKRR